MHYKNGREAQEGDPVVGMPQYGTKVYAGTIIDINPGSETCNATLLRGAGPPVIFINVKDFYHAEDANKAANLVIGPSA